ncbi:GRIA2 [Branchiostoma lanceolatum]|uniref:GRIA2 protein n=1 Tax=Branchiostoma lanceolatum TaxID=7740 RepID=A0A8J9ZDP0_BRALA|nr:GRIA2 [Branchiostoma lanceolatum]
MAWAVALLVGTLLGVTCTVSAQERNATGDIGSRTVIVGAIEYHNFLHKREDGTYAGFHMDFLTELEQMLGIDFVIQEPADGKYGYLTEDGTWVGMVGELVRGEIDIALGLTMASMRERVIDFSTPLTNERLEMLIKKPGRQLVRREWWYAIMTLPVWFMIMASFLLVGIVMFVIIRVSPYENRAYSAEVGEASRLSTFGHSLWLCFSAMSWQGVDYSPRSLSGRFLYVFWFGFIVWTLILCTGATVGFLTVPAAAPPMVPVQSFGDLAANDEIRPAYFAGGATEAYFKNSLFPSYHRIHQRAILVRSEDEGIRLAREGGVAFIAESASTLFFSNRKPCDLMAISDDVSLTARHQAVGLQANSPLREVINSAILQLRERGRLYLLYRKWMIDRGECPRSDSPPTPSASFAPSKPLDHWDIMPIFIELVVAAILALCIMGIEVKWDKRTSKSPQKKTGAAPSGNSAGQRDDDTNV